MDSGLFFSFQVARNLMRRSAHRRPKRIANAAFRLLNVCLGIIDQKKHPQVGLLLLFSTSIHYSGSNQIDSISRAQCVVIVK